MFSTLVLHFILSNLANKTITTAFASGTFWCKYLYIRDNTFCKRARFKVYVLGPRLSEEAVTWAESAAS